MCGRRPGKQGVAANTVVKTVLTGAAVASTVASGVLGSRVAAAGNVPARGATEPSAGTPPEVAAAQTGLRRLQWAIPALTGTLAVLTAIQGEQQRPAEVIRGVVSGAATTLGHRLHLAS